MANIEEGQVGFKAADGKEYTLELTTRAERAIQKRLGNKPMGAIAQELGSGNVEVMVAIFFECLKKHHKDVKEEDAVDFVRPRELRRLVTEVLAAAYPSEEENPPQPGQDETGSAS